MSPLATLQFLAIEAIDIDNTTYRLRPGSVEDPDPQLVDSIAQYGILQPPLLHGQEAGRAIVLSGRRRIVAAARLELTEIPALLVPDPTPISTRLELLLEHARLGSELSIIEEAILVKKAEQWLPEEEVLHLLTRLGHTPGPHVIRRLTSLLELENSAVMALHRQVLHPKAGRRLARLGAEDQREIVHRITSLRLGGSKQYKLVDLATELIMRRNRPLREMLAEMEAETGWDKETDNIPQQASTLLRWLHKQCFPRSEAAAADFQRFCRRLELPSGVRVHHAPAFESDRLTLTIEIQDQRELEQRWPEMRKILMTPGKDDRD